MLATCPQTWPGTKIKGGSSCSAEGFSSVANEMDGKKASQAKKTTNDMFLCGNLAISNQQAESYFISKDMTDFTMDAIARGIMSSQSTDESTVFSDPLMTPLSESAGHVILDERIGGDDEERKLILASVEHVDCKDFPFEEVLSLEDAVKEEMRHCANKRLRLRNNESDHVIISQKGTGIIKEKSIGGKAGRAGRKNRPPLLKCPTWPESYDQQIEIAGSDSSKKATQESKLDSPSFYCKTAIDFSAISHLSEEHDRILAQEKAEKEGSKSSLISETTKEKLYGKATQRSNSMNGNAKAHARPDRTGQQHVVFTVSSEAINPTLISGLAPVTNKRHTTCGVQKMSNLLCDSGKKTTKSPISPLEKAFRKRYASTSGVTVTSLPLSSLQNEGKSLPSTPTHQAKPDIESLLVPVDRSEAAKKQQHAGLEKQPLPPEGFKISRYPLTNKNPSTPKVVSPDSCEKNLFGEAELLRIISELRKQLEKAEERISEVEKEAKEWKERAQQIFRAKQTIKESEAAKKRGIFLDNPKNCESGIKYDVTHSKHCKSDEKTNVRRWSDETLFVKHDVNNNNPTCLHPIDGNLPGNFPEVSHIRAGGCQKRVATGDGAFQRKRQRMSDVNQHLSEEKHRSMLEWLSNTEPDEEIDYMSFLGASTPPNKDNPPISVNNTATGTKMSANFTTHATQRSLSHEEVRKALRAKVEGTKCEVMKQDITKMPLRPKDSIDRFLDTLTASPMNNSEREQQKQCPSDSMSPVSDKLPRDQISDASPPSLLHSLSDSELQSIDGRRTSADPAPPTAPIFRTISNSESFPNLSKATGATDCHENADFLSQLGYILDL
ncbi:unnamed protein product [Clavelina lepadiformis]|uniref:Uncharacterized protein n=1 Tax=Clavelina lepadiformis TaxID=159417 RepID=A0ABP0G4K0_CLALP